MGVRGKWIGATAGGCAQFSIFENNPKFGLSILLYKTIREKYAYFIKIHVKIRVFYEKIREKYEYFVKIRVFYKNTRKNTRIL